ncbi:MAG: hypothetical protein AAF902_14575 [Chloroflexota bacterium]
MISQRNSEFISWPHRNVLLVATGVDHGWLSTFSGAAASLQTPLNLVALHHDENLKNVAYFLSDLNNQQYLELLIIPQGELCMKQLMVDPRVHMLINETVDHGGLVAFGGGAELLLSQMPMKYRLLPGQVCLQRNLKTAEFAQQLLSSKLV